MTSTIRKSIPMVAVLSCVIISSVSAQPRGEGPLVLRLPSSARSLSLANAGIASTDADAIFYNPGMLASIRGSAVSMQRYGSFATAGSMATTTITGSTTIGIGAQYVSYTAPTGATFADIVQSGGTHLSDSAGVSAASTALTFGVAKTIRGLQLGASVKFAEDRIGARHDGVMAFDIGMNRALGPGTLGVVLQNLGGGPRIDGIKGTLPRRFGVGWGASRAIAANWDIGAQTALTVEGNWFVRPAGGGEITYVPIDGIAITVRQGFRLPRERDESLITAGLGFTVDRIAVDYAMEPMRGRRPVSHRVGIRIR